MENLAPIHMQIHRSQGDNFRLSCLWLVIRMTSTKEHVTQSTSAVKNRYYLSFKQIIYFAVLKKSVDKNYGIKSKSYIV